MFRNLFFNKIELPEVTNAFRKKSQTSISKTGNKKYGLIEIAALAQNAAIKNRQSRDLSVLWHPDFGLNLSAIVIVKKLAAAGFI